VADVFREYGEEYRSNKGLTKKQRAVMYAIEHCRTSAFGYHVDQCDECGYRDAAHNSCRDRHCPKCQGISRRKWINARLQDILPVSYYHVVFTLPHHLFPLSLYNKQLVYELFLQCSSGTLITFGRDPEWLGATIGFYGLLHSWGQTLWQHIHGHFIVAGGGLTEDGRWVEPRYRNKFLFPVPALSKVFRGKFIEGLKKAYYRDKLVIPDELNHLKQADEFEKWVDELVARNWVVYAKPPFAGPEELVNYIGRYTHRVAISNHRLLSIANGEIRFQYKDYKDKKKTAKQMSLKAHDFIQRFLWHVLPEGFHKIRHYGFLANGKAKTKVAQIRELLQQSVTNKEEESCMDNAGMLCPICKKGRLLPSLIMDRFGRIIVRGLAFFKSGYAYDTT